MALSRSMGMYSTSPSSYSVTSGSTTTSSPSRCAKGTTVSRALALGLA